MRRILSLVLSDKPRPYTARGAVLLLPPPGQQWLARFVREHMPYVAMSFDM